MFIIPPKCELIFFGQNGESTIFTGTTIFPNWTAVYDKYAALQAPGNVYQVPTAMMLMIKLIAYTSGANAGNAAIQVGGAVTRTAYTSYGAATDNSCVHTLAFMRQYAAAENISWAANNSSGVKRLLGNDVIGGQYHTLEIWRLNV